jgi:hypothetical protein
VWSKYSCVYAVPGGQGVAIFAFVCVYPYSNSSGSPTTDVFFASGFSLSSNQSVSFTSEAQLSAATQPGYAYGLAEVRGSTAMPLVGSA